MTKMFIIPRCRHNNGTARFEHWMDLALLDAQLVDGARNANRLGH